VGEGDLFCPEDRGVGGGGAMPGQCECRSYQNYLNQAVSNHLTTLGWGACEQGVGGGHKTTRPDNTNNRAMCPPSGAIQYFVQSTVE
jgi:hypothetical protein